MTDTQASIGYGITLEMADVATPTVFTYIAEIYDLDLPSESTNQQDASHYQSPNKTMEFIDGMTDPGEASFSMNFVPGSPSDRYLTAAKGKRKINRITFPNGCQNLFRGTRQNYEKTAPLDGKMEATVSIKVSGDPILTDPTAPRAIAVPVITGTAKVGVPLELDPGIWAGAMALSYQWQADSADIDGAIGASFVPAIGNIGDLIRCEVTATNDNFTTVVNTTATVAVVA